MNVVKKLFLRVATLILILSPLQPAFPQAPPQPEASAQPENTLDSFDQQSINDFPIARNVWSLLQTQHIASVPDRIDEGGFQTGTIQLMGVHGGTWTQNGYRWDGINITNPYEPGKPLTYPLFGMLQELHANTVFHSAEVSSPGADFEMTSRRGDKAFHGDGQVYYLGQPFQSSNLDSRLRTFGFTTTPHFKQFPEA